MHKSMVALSFFDSQCKRSVYQKNKWNKYVNKKLKKMQTATANIPIIITLLYINAWHLSRYK